jgi:hypothetical protein
MLQDAMRTAKKSEFFMGLPTQERKQIEERFGDAQTRIDKRRSGRGRK